MSLNKTFTGNIVDKDGASISNIDVYAYHKESNDWSDVYNTGSETQYSVNGGDAQWLSQTGSMNTGDTVLLKFETTEADVLDRQFALLQVTMTSDDVYVNDIQLMDCQVPNVSGLWTLSSAVDGSTTFDNTSAGGNANTYIGRINAEETASTNFNDNYSWAYGGNTLRHVESWLGQDIFSDRIGVAKIEFDWVADATYVENDTTHTYTAISSTAHDDTVVAVKVTNDKGQIVTDELYLQLRYNTPIPGIGWTPDSPSVLDTFTITGETQDVDTVVTNISWQFDNTEIANNGVLDYSWTQDLGDTYVVSYVVSSDVTWSDGFNSHTIEYDETVYMTNTPPTFTVLVEQVGDYNDNDRKFTLVDLVDPDGDDGLLEVKWKIEYKTPFDNLWKTVQDNGYPGTPNLGSKEWIFTVSGDYRITTTAKDAYGLETEVESLVTFDTLEGGGQATGRIRLNNNVWQLIAIPVQNKNVNDYFLSNIEAQLQTYDSNTDITDVIEVVNAYPGHVDKFYSFVPGITNTASESNFPLTVDDGSIKEVTAFWVKMKDYYSITNNEDIIFEWDQAD